MKIDDIISKRDPKHSDLITLKRIINQNVNQNYFWSKLNQSKWLPILNEEGFFEILLKKSVTNDTLYITQSFVSEYLLNVAEKYPSQVIEIIKATDTDNDRVIWNFVRIGLVLNAQDTSKLVPVVKKWMDKLKIHSTLFDSEIIKWIKHLSDARQFDASFRLLKLLTTPKIQKPTRKIDDEVEKILGKNRPKPAPAIEYYYLQQLLSKGLNKLVEHDPSKLSRILQSALEKSISIEYRHIKGGLDLSYIWRAAIEDHPQNYEHYELNDALLVALRNSTEEIVKQDLASGMIVIEEYLKHKYSIFRRLAIHLLRLNYESYSDFIRRFIKNKKLLKQTDISHEYFILLRDIFEKLGFSERKFIIDSIREIESCDRKAKLEIQQKQIRYQHLEKLHFFEKYLEGEDKIYYDQLKQEFHGEKLRDTAVYHESYYGEKSPLTIDEIENKNLPELWDYFKTFRKTKKGFGSPSIEGLARYFASAVKKDPYKYLKSDLNNLITINPTYSYWFLNEITETFKSQKYEELIQFIPDLLNLINKLIRIENIPNKFTEEMGINFTGVKRRALDFIQMTIKSSQNGTIDIIAYKDIIWEMIEYLCYYKFDPDDMGENKKEKLDPYTSAINSVRGNALISAIDYALWYASQTKDNYSLEDKFPNRFEGEKRIQDLLEDKLINKQDDPSLAIHSVYGVYFANLAYLNFNWLKSNLNNIFPNEKEKEVYWQTAWGGFINASRFYSDLYKLLQPQFFRAVDYLSKGMKLVPSGFGRSPEDALSEHLIVACLNLKDDIRKKNSLLRKFAEAKNNPSATHAVQFIANLAKDQRIFFDDPELKVKSFWPQAKAFWEIRINSVNQEIEKKARKKEDQFDREFSRYISWLDDLPENVTLKQLEPLLFETIKINQRGWQLPDFITYLSRQSEKYPLIAIRLFEKLMHTKAPMYFYQGKEKEIERILENAVETEKPEAYYYADYITNTFGEWGNYYFKDFWMSNLKDINVNKLKTPKSMKTI